MYYPYVDSWHIYICIIYIYILKYLYTYILDVFYILDLPASRKKCSTCFSMRKSRQDRRFCCFKATLQHAVCYSQKIYIGMHTLSYNTHTYTSTGTIQLHVCSDSFWFFLIHLWFMYQFIGINASSVSIHTLSDSCGFTAASAEKRTV